MASLYNHFRVYIHGGMIVRYVLAKMRMFTSTLHENENQLEYRLNRLNVILPQRRFNPARLFLDPPFVSAHKELRIAITANY